MNEEESFLNIHEGVTVEPLLFDFGTASEEEAKAHIAKLREKLGTGAAKQIDKETEEKIRKDYQKQLGELFSSYDSHDDEFLYGLKAYLNHSNLSKASDAEKLKFVNDLIVWANQKHETATDLIINKAKEIEEATMTVAKLEESLEKNRQELQEMRNFLAMSSNK